MTHPVELVDPRPTARAGHIQESESSVARGRHAATAGKLRLGRRRTIRVGERGPMALLLADGVEGLPVGLGRFYRIEPKSRDASFLHAALPL